MALTVPVLEITVGWLDPHILSVEKMDTWYKILNVPPWTTEASKTKIH